MQGYCAAKTNHLDLSQSHENLLMDMNFVSIMMDVVQSGRMKLFATNLIASYISHDLTHSTPQIYYMDHDIIRRLFEFIFTSRLVIAITFRLG
jgi:hypothetical protein